jgi:hypothetical protein
MKFTLEIELGNEAMRTGADVGRALDNTVVPWLIDIGNLPLTREHGRVRDINGNTVGKWEVTD